MSVFQNKTRSPSIIKTHLKNGNARKSSKFRGVILTGEVEWEEDNISDEYQCNNVVLKRANTVKLIQIFNFYGIDVDEYNCIIRCPFIFHNDSNPSFKYYSSTNSFYCHGCNNGGGPVQFVTLIENISILEAAEVILNDFEGDEINSSLFIKSKEREDLYLKFSKMIRDFIRNHNSFEDFEFINEITKAFDSSIMGRGKRNVDINGVRYIIGTLEKKIMEKL